MATPQTHVRNATTKGWLVIIGLILSFWALKAAYSVFMPIAASAFLVALVYPLYRRLRDGTHAVLAFLAAFGTVLAGFAVFFALVGWALSSVVTQLPQYEASLRQSIEAVHAATERVGLTLPDPQQALGDDTGSGLISNVAQQVGLKLQAFLTYFFLVLAFVALGLPDTTEYAKKFGTTGGIAMKLRETAEEVGHKFRVYTGAVTISAAITAVLTASFGFAIGLEFALVFALLSFLMNYIPTIGSVIAVVPPSLFALVQFDGLAMPLVVFLGFTAIELTVGNYIAPKIEGRILSLAPTVVLAAIVFWGWLWGIVGALLAVPLTLAIALFARRFESARWVSYVIREHDDGEAMDTRSADERRERRAPHPVAQE